MKPEIIDGLEEAKQMYLKECERFRNIYMQSRLTHTECLQKQVDMMEAFKTAIADLILSDV